MLTGKRAHRHDANANHPAGAEGGCRLEGGFSSVEADASARAPIRFTVHNRRITNIKPTSTTPITPTPKTNPATAVNPMAISGAARRRIDQAARMYETANASTAVNKYMCVLVQRAEMT